MSKLEATEVAEKWEVVKTKGVDIQSLAELLNEDITPINNTLRSYLVSKSVTKSVTKLVTKLIPLVDNLNTEKTRAEMMDILQLSNQSKNYNAYIKPLLKNGIIEMTEPDKPTSSLQRYRLTEKGKKLSKN